MPTYLAFLRAVNVGGTGKLPMADLKAWLAKLRPDEFQRAVSSYVSPMLRSGQKVAVSIWDKIQGRERLHDRFILCEHGGLSIQGGADLGPAGETTTISRVSSETAREIISRFELSAPGQPNPFYQRVHTFEVN